MDPLTLKDLTALGITLVLILGLSRLVIAPLIALVKESVEAVNELQKSFTRLSGAIEKNTSVHNGQTEMLHRLINGQVVAEQRLGQQMVLVGKQMTDFEIHMAKRFNLLEKDWNGGKEIND